MKNVYFLNALDMEEDLKDVTISISINGRLYFAEICPLELEKSTRCGKTTYTWVARKLPVTLLSTDDTHIPDADTNTNRGLGHAD